MKLGAFLAPLLMAVLANAGKRAAMQAEDDMFEKARKVSLDTLRNHELHLADDMTGNTSVVSIVATDFGDVQEWHDRARPHRRPGGASSGANQAFTDESAETAEGDLPEPGSIPVVGTKAWTAGEAVTNLSRSNIRGKQHVPSISPLNASLHGALALAHAPAELVTAHVALLVEVAVAKLPAVADGLSRQEMKDKTKDWGF